MKDAKHIHYVEPYFGGGSVLLAKSPYGVSEVVNDLDSRLVNFWEVLREPALFQVLQRKCEATPFCEATWKYASKMLENEALGADFCPVDRAWAFFVHCRQSLAGRMKCFSGITKTRVRRGMNNEVSAWISSIEGLPAIHERLMRVLILDAQPALQVIKKHNGPQTLFYLDPPYLHETRKTTKEYGSFEMTEADHLELLQTLQGIKGKVCLSGYRSALYDGFADAQGWRRVEFAVPNNAAGGKKKRRMVECVWMNFKEQPTLFDSLSEEDE